MGAPSKARQLADLDPREIAKAVVDLVLDHIQTLSFHLDPGATIQVSSPTATSLGFSVALLTQWAQTGTNAENWTAGVAMDGIQQICEALYSCAGEPRTFGGGAIDDIRGELDAEEDDIDLLLLAAHGRVQLTSIVPGAVHYRELAALSGLSGEGVRKLVQREELRSANGAGLVNARDALRWLGSRGVPGFDR
jgi:hypothetical protein